MSENKSKPIKVKTKYAKSGPLLLIAAPGILYLLINNYIPMFGIFLAFKNFSYKKGIWKSPWNGFQNFKFLFHTKDAIIMTRNTILYNLAFIVIGTIFAITIAILLNALGDSIRTKFFQSSLLLPNLMSWVIIAYMVYAFLNSDSGFINNTILEALGKEDVAWYMERGYWPFILTIVYLWKNAGYMSIIYLAAIAGIDKSVYEAASLDGATKMQQIFRITLPLLKPTVIIMTLMAVGRIFFSDFGLFYQVPMNSGALYATTQTIDTYVYRGLMELNDVGMSAAAGLFQSVLGFIIVVTANAVVRKVDSDNALF
ncbi:ABC transporter permease [Butyrivibrio sp. FCS014]|uniref:ABC transporter permease n=1 Tax=Butyrivibrio sp. FCS014 TaxID=1408304 RepID=UPI000467383B|nr:ABC transporter permease subunit [Butyrivibrio sp. FCS014]